MTIAPPITRQEADALCVRLASRHYENFAVASLVVPRHLRVHLARIYAFCRTTDDLGDESGDSALWRLGLWQSEVEAMLDGRPPVHPVLIALAATVDRFAIPSEPFLDLIAANVQDQRVSAYATWEELRAYCMLSAAPVGRMVLRVFEIADPRAVPLSDDVCIGLQLANFAQDVAVDRGKGRTYLIGEDLEKRGLPGAVEAMCDRATALLASGRRLEELDMSNRLRLQLSLYRRGGEAIIEAIRREGFHTDLRRPAVSTPTKLRLVAGALGTGVRERQRSDPASLAVAAAERHCQRMARQEAANFYWGFIALPREPRVAIYSLYDFARQVDDAADGHPEVSADGHVGEREPLDLGGRQRFAAGYPGPGTKDAERRIAAQREELERQRARVRAALTDGVGIAEDPVMLVLSRAARRYAIPLSELEELVSGVEMDLTTTRYRTWGELRTYCHLVAGVVGRMCVRIFGFDGAEALEHADSLGIALQLINILRDVREDASMGRVYLPHDELARFGVSEDSLLRGSPDGEWAALVAHEAARARRLYASGIEVCRYIPAPARACVRTMAGIYRGILERIEVDPDLPLRERVRLSSGEKAGVMVRAWVAATATGRLA
jgi:phytoene synthase